MAETKKALVFLANGFEEVEAVTPIDFLRRAGIEVLVAGVGSKEITGAHGITVNCDTALDSNNSLLGEGFDVIICPGGMPGAENLHSSQEVNDLLLQQWERKAHVAAICAAPAVVLAPIDILKGRRFTCFPGFETRVSNGKFSEERVVIDGNLISSRGAGTAAEFSVAIISQLLGDEAGTKIHNQTLQK